MFELESGEGMSGEIFILAIMQGEKKINSLFSKKVKWLD